MYKQITGKEPIDWKIDRNDIILIRIIEKLGNKASGEYSKLIIEEIDDNLDYEIYDHDGKESIIIRGN